MDVEKQLLSLSQLRRVAQQCKDAVASKHFLSAGDIRFGAQVDFPVISNEWNWRVAARREVFEFRSEDIERFIDLCNVAAQSGLRSKPFEKLIRGSQAKVRSAFRKIRKVFGPEKCERAVTLRDFEAVRSFAALCGQAALSGPKGPMTQSKLQNAVGGEKRAFAQVRHIFKRKIHKV